MWIKKPNQILEDSGSQFVNFLFQEDNIFIMDNHLAAGWCWMSYLDKSFSYNLFHIDRHEDLLDDRAMLQSQIVDQNINVSKLNFDDYCSLLNTSCENFKLFRWDNYLINTHILFPNFFNKKYFASHEECPVNKDFVEVFVSFDELIGNLPYYVKRFTEKKWIINIDIDYFFGQVGSKIIQVFTDGYITSFAEAVKKSIPNTAIVTLCLSPECCGGWENAIRVTKIICEVLEISFSLDEYKYED